MGKYTSEKRYYAFNTPHFRQYSGMGFTPIIEVHNGKAKLFLPLFLNFEQFCRIADIADEARHKVKLSEAGNWTLTSAVAPLEDGNPEWRIHLSSEGLWSVWADTRAVNGSETAYNELQAVASETLDRFLHELTRLKGAAHRAAVIVGADFITQHPAQGLPEEG